MGLLDALSAGIGAAAPAGAALAQGQAQATQSNTGFLEKLAAMQQAKQKADMDRQLQTAQIGDIQAQQQQRSEQTKALSQKFSPDNIQAASKTWGVDPTTAEMMLRDPATLAYILEKKKTATPMKVSPGEAVQKPDGSWYVPVAKSAKDEEPVSVPGTDAAGKPIAYRVRKSGGPAEVVEGFQGKAAGKAGGVSAGALTSLPDLLRTHVAMSVNENDPKFALTPRGEMTEGAQYGVKHAEVKGQAPSFGSLAMGTVGKLMGGVSNPEQAYLQNSRAFGEDAANAWRGRTNEERVLRDITTGSLTSQNITNPTARSQVQERRQNVIAMTAIANPAQFDALPAAQKQVIQGYIQQLPPEKMVQAQQDAAGRGVVPQASASTPTADQPTGKPRDPKFGIFGNP